MSEKKQHNAHFTQLKMQDYYDDEYHHKHDKSHLTFRRHCRTHPVKIQKIESNHDDSSNTNLRTGRIRDGNIKKIRTKMPRHHEYFGNRH